jgi:zinc protease
VQKYLPADKMYIVVVGDRAKAFPGLAQLGYDVQELDLNGGPITAAAAPTQATTLGAPSMPAMPDGKNKTEKPDGTKIKTKKKGGE